MAPLNYRSAEDCMFFYNCRKGFLQTVISLYCHPALDWHLKSLCIASDKTTRDCNYLHWSEIWPSCPLQFGGKSLISFMGRETAGARQGYWPRPAGEELTAAKKKNISNVSAHESSRSCAVRAIPVKKISSRFPRVEEEEALRQTGMRSRGRCSMPLPPSGEVKKEEEMAQLSSQPVESPESKYQTRGTMEKTKSGLVRVEQARTSEQSVKTRHWLVWRTRPLISQSHQVITPGDFPAWQKEGLISRAWKVLMKWSEGKARASEGA